MIGTIAAGCSFYWSLYYWPERFQYINTPLAFFLVVGSHLSDLLYAFALRTVKRREREIGRLGGTNGDATRKETELRKRE